MTTSGPFTTGDPTKPHDATAAAASPAALPGAASPAGSGGGGSLAVEPPEPTMGTNPHDDPEGWGTVTLAGTIVFPGIVTEISGADREWGWKVEKASKKGGATATFEGEKSCESLKITCDCPRRSHFAELFAFRDAVAPPKGQKPATFTIQNQAINFNKITRVSIKKFGQPKWDKKANSWSVELEFLENNPSTASATGPQDPAKPDGAGGKDGAGKEKAAPKDAADIEIEALTKKAQAA